MGFDCEDRRGALYRVDAREDVLSADGYAQIQEMVSEVSIFICSAAKLIWFAR